MERIQTVIEQIEDEITTKHIPEKGEYETKDAFTDARRKYHLEVDEFEKSKFKVALFEELGIVGHPKAEMLFNMAWLRGYGNGLYEVFQEALELVELIK